MIVGVKQQPKLKTRDVEINIGNIGNYYGGLRVKQGGDKKYYWGIADWDTTRWHEIPKPLFTSLVRYEKSRKKSK